MTAHITKKIDLQLVGLNGNAFNLLGAFGAQARREGWTKDEINDVLKEAMAGNYDHLLGTLALHCEPTTEAPPDRIEDGWTAERSEDET